MCWSPTKIYSAVLHQLRPQQRPRDRDALHQGAALDRPGRPGRRPTSRSASAEGSDIPYIWTDRTVWAIGAQPKVQNFNNPTTPAGGKAYGMITGADLAHPDLAQLLIFGTGGP